MLDEEGRCSMEPVFTPTSVLSLLLSLSQSAFAEVAINQIVRTGSSEITKGVVKWLVGYASKNNIQYEERMMNKIARMIIGNKPLFLRILAHLKLASSERMLFVGPSGSGKTMLVRSLMRRQLLEDDVLTTTETEHHRAVLNRGKFVIGDAPGQEYFACLSKVWDEVANRTPKILVIVMANGYLDTMGTGYELTRPKPFAKTERLTFEKPEDFLSYTRQEELEWLKYFNQEVITSKQSVNYVLIVINKKELWIDDFDTVIKRYKEGPIKDLLDEITKKLAQAGQTPQFATLSARFNNFKREIRPSRTFDRDAAIYSVRIFESLLAALLVDGKLK